MINVENWHVIGLPYRSSVSNNVVGSLIPMYTNTYFGGTTSGGSGGGTTGGATTQQVQSQIESTVTQSFVSGLNVSASNLKDSRTTPTELPPAKYARLYETPTNYQDKVYSATSADTASTATIATSALALKNPSTNAIIGTESFAQKSSVAQDTVYNANRLNNAPASDYALITQIPNIQLYARKHIPGDDSTLDNVYNAYRLGDQPSNFYSKKYVVGNSDTEHTVYNAAKLNNVDASQYALVSQLPQATNLTAYAKKHIPGDDSTLDNVYNAYRLGGIPSNFFVQNVAKTWREMGLVPITTGFSQWVNQERNNGTLSSEISWSNVSNSIWFVSYEDADCIVLPTKASWGGDIVTPPEINLANLSQMTTIKVAASSDEYYISARTLYSGTGSTFPQDRMYVKVPPGGMITCKFVYKPLVTPAKWLIVGSLV